MILRLILPVEISLVPIIPATCDSGSQPFTEHVSEFAHFRYIHWVHALVAYFFSG